MYVIVEHAINNPKRFGEIMQSAEIPKHRTLHHSFPKGDGTQAVCHWEGPSVAAVRTYVEDGVGHVSSNGYYAVDAEKAMGLPVSA